MDKFYRTTGVFGVALLALTACGDPGTPADDQTEEEDAGAEGQDPDGAEDQGDHPDEIAGEEDEDDAGGEPDDETMDPPSFSEIEEDIWESSLDHDSVTIEVLIQEDIEDEDDAPEIGAAGSAEDEDGEDLEGEELTIAGDMEGDGAVRAFSHGEQRIFDDGERVLESNEFFVATYEESRPEDAEGLQPEELEEWLDERGDWVHVTEAVDLEMIETPGEFITNLREGFESAVSESDAEGEADTVEGENVWIYEIENAVFAVAADEDEPHLVSYQAQEFDVSFEDWDETDEVEEPDEDTVIEFAELEEAVMEASN
ncbi:hypothetical protein [Nesterenkonia populi]